MKSTNINSNWQGFALTILLSLTLGFWGNALPVLAHGGEVVDGKLKRTEESLLIFNFDIRKADKTLVNVRVDANSGEVLKPLSKTDSDN